MISEWCDVHLQAMLWAAANSYLGKVKISVRKTERERIRAQMGRVRGKQGDCNNEDRGCLDDRKYLKNTYGSYIFS